jgi:hypothetical protein
MHPLRAWRVKNDITLIDLAAMTGVSKWTLLRIELQKARTLDVRDAISIATATSRISKRGRVTVEQLAASV